MVEDIRDRRDQVTEEVILARDQVKAENPNETMEINK